MDYDVIIVGGRVAGGATGMLLARGGLRVLVVDQARFPSDTLSTHQIQLPGVACLRRWGLLDKVEASGAPPTREVRFQYGRSVLTGAYPQFEGVDAIYSPRRFILDAILVDAARAAGAEVVEGFVVTGLTTDGDRVTGVRGADKGGRERVISARLVIGADGKHSKVAKWAGAREHLRRPIGSCGFYTYFSGLPSAGGEIYQAERRIVSLWPTNDNLTLAYVALPVQEFAGFRANLEAGFFGAFDDAGARNAVGSGSGSRHDLGGRLRSARRSERFRGTPDMPNVFRQASGPGWALVGDAGLVMDPITGQGIGNAFRDAEALSQAILGGWPDPAALYAGLARFAKKRDVDRMPMYDMTTDLTAFRATRRAAIMFAAIEQNEHAIERFLGVLTGAISPKEFFAPGALAKLLGVRTVLRVIGADTPDTLRKYLRIRPWRRTSIETHLNG